MKQKSKIWLAEQKETLKMKRTARIISESEYQKQIRLIEDFEDDVKSLGKADLGSAVDLIRKFIQDPEFKEKIKSGEADGDASDDVIKFSEANPSCTEMFPTQAEIGFDNSLADIVNDKYGAIDSAFSSPALMPSPDGKVPVLTASVGGKIVILDGHHRWSLCFMINPEGAMKCDVMEPPAGYTSVDALKIMQLAIASSAGKIVTKPFEGKNLMATSTDEVIKYISDNIGEKEIATFTKYKKELNSKEAIAAYIGESHKKIIKVKGENTRTIMPQAGKSGTTQDTVNKALEKGEINFNEPFATKESINKKLESVLQESIATWKKHRRK